ncbi:collagen, type I, alpha 1a-like [Oryctolagus cuniculus]|uniref:collagen, type I, alpha 1a-like n=1 Tax=Oryctolagus cuniculus TaxID=9986 RepID=UPI003878FD05
MHNFPGRSSRPPGFPERCGVGVRARGRWRSHREGSALRRQLHQSSSLPQLHSPASPGGGGNGALGGAADAGASARVAGIPRQRAEGGRRAETGTQTPLSRTRGPADTAWPGAFRRESQQGLRYLGGQGRGRPTARPWRVLGPPDADNARAAVRARLCPPPEPALRPGHLPGGRAVAPRLLRRAAGGGRRRGLAAEPSGGTGAAAPSRGLRHRQRRRRCASSGPRAAAPPLPRAGRAGGAALRAPRPRLALARRARQLGGWRVLPGTPVSRAPLSGRGASGALGAQLPRCARFPPPSTSSLGYPQARTPESPLVSGDHQAWGPDLAAAGLSRRGAPAYRVLRRRAPKEWPRVTPALGPGESGFRRQRQPGGLPWRCLALVPGRPSEAVICSALTTCVCLPPVPGRHLQRELPGLTDRHTRLLGKKEGLLRSPGKAEPRQPQLATACPRLQPLRTSTGRGLCAESRLTRRHICWEGRGQLKYLHARFFRKQVPEEMPAFQDPLQGGKSREYGTSAERSVFVHMNKTWEAKVKQQPFHSESHHWLEVTLLHFHLQQP